MIDRLSVERAVTDRQGDRVTERALATLFERASCSVTSVARGGPTKRVVTRARRRCVATSVIVAPRSPPTEGCPLLDQAPGVDVDVGGARARDGRGCPAMVGRPHDGAASAHVRVGYGQLDEREVDAAIAKLAKAL